MCLIERRQSVVKRKRPTGQALILEDKDSALLGGVDPHFQTLTRGGLTISTRAMMIIACDVVTRTLLMTPDDSDATCVVDDAVRR